MKTIVSTLICLAMFLSISLPDVAFALQWSISNPEADEDFDDNATIGCSGNGPEESTYTVKLKRNGVVLQSASGSTAQSENWAEDLSPPPPNYDWGSAGKATIVLSPSGTDPDVTREIDIVEVA